MKKIKWKYSKAMNCYEGLVDGVSVFTIEGHLCLLDRRENIKSGFGKNFISPYYYRIIDPENGKQIAHDLLNSLNIEVHEKNRKEWEEEGERIAKLMADVDKMIKDLRAKENMK